MTRRQLKEKVGLFIIEYGDFIGLAIIVLMLLHAGKII